MTPSFFFYGPEIPPILFLAVPFATSLIYPSATPLDCLPPGHTTGYTRPEMALLLATSLEWSPPSDYTPEMYPTGYTPALSPTLLHP